MVNFIKKIKFWGYNPDDNMQNRRDLAFFSAVYALAIWPNLLLFLHLFFKLDVTVINAMLTYVGTVAGTSIGGYLWASMKEPTKPKDKDDG